MQLTVVNTANPKTLTLVASDKVVKSTITVDGETATIVDYPMGTPTFWIRRPSVAAKVGSIIEMDKDDDNLHLIVPRD